MDTKGKTYHHCPFCNYKSVKETALKTRIQFHTRERPFFCDQCKRGFASKSFLSVHKLRVHQGIKEEYKKKYKCSHCPYATYATGSLKSHTQLHNDHEDRSFPCHHPDCQYVGKLSDYLRQHIARVHNNKRKFVCQLSNCGYRGKTRADLKTHYVTHSEDRPFICDFEGCSYRSKFKKAVRAHKLRVHHDGQMSFTCSVCNRCFASKDSLRGHKLIHSEMSVKCSFSGCAFSCKVKKYLNKHVLNCHTERIFKCDFTGCSSVMASQTTLKMHKKITHGQKIYECPSCDFRTAYQGSLRKHIERHKGRRSIPCPRKGCTFLMTHRQHLWQHLRYHKSCPVEGCSHVSQSDSSWSKHMQLHDPTGKPFHCPLCPRHYPTSQQLSYHLQIHTQEKPFKCPKCNYTAVKKGLIKTHVLAVHPSVASSFNDEFICNHCTVDFGSAVCLAIHKIKLKTAIVAVYDTVIDTHIKLR